MIGFGGHSTGQVLFGGEGESVIYPCHSLVVNMDIQSGQQRFYIGHTDKVWLIVTYNSICMRMLAYMYVLS